MFTGERGRDRGRDRDVARRVDAEVEQTGFRDDAILDGVSPSVLEPIADFADRLVVPALQLRVQDLENVRHFWVEVSKKEI